VSPAGGSISLLVGVTLLRLTLTGTYTRYVRVGMGPFLVVAGVVLVLLGVTTLVRSRRAPAAAGHDDEHHDHDHGEHDHGGHGHTERVGWLLLAPVVALLLVAPPALGSYGVDRGAVVDVTAGASDLVPLDPGDGPVAMTLLEFSQRAHDHGGESFEGATVELTGFVADDAAPFRLARYQIACCAVDAAPLLVRVTGAVGDLPRRDAWVTVTGTFRAVEDGLPTLAATGIAEVPAPDDPYE
jgi:uncharacterized repeat protein (TIGR03943 family)